MFVCVHGNRWTGGQVYNWVPVCIATGGNVHGNGCVYDDRHMTVLLLLELEDIFGMHLWV